MGDQWWLMVKTQPAMQESQEMKVQSLGGEDPLEEGKPLQYSCLENAKTEEPGRL